VRRLIELGLALESELLSFAPPKESIQRKAARCRLLPVLGTANGSRRASQQLTMKKEVQIS